MKDTQFFYHYNYWTRLDTQLDIVINPFSILVLYLKKQYNGRCGPVQFGFGFEID